MAVPLLVAGCVGELGSGSSEADRDPGDLAEGGGGGDAGVPSEPGVVESVNVVQIREIESSGELALERECFELAATGEHLFVSPDGQAWVVLESDGTDALLQVIDPAVGAPEPPRGFEVPRIVGASAWTGESASFITVEGLWRLEGAERIQVQSPLDGGEASSFCGDLSSRGAVLSSGSLYEMRGDEWWQYTAPVDAPDQPTELVRFDGSCTDTDEAHWLTGEAGTIWRVGRDSVSVPIQIEGASAASGTAGLLGVMTDSQVWFGSIEGTTQTWQPWELPGGATPSWLGLAGGAAWLIAGSELFRFDGESWSHTSEAIAAASHFSVYGTGLWAVEGSEACHYSMGPPIQLEGIRPFDRTRDQLVPVVIHTADKPVVAVNGAPLSVTSDEVGHHVTVRLDEVGWSELSVSVGSLRRNLWVKRIPTEVRSWEADVAPIYETSCRDADCHNSSGEPDSPPDLGSFEAWLSHSYEIRARVIEDENMPPPANRGPEWSDAQREIILEWLEGGLLP